MAAAACQLADDAPSFDGKANYLRLASAWHQLAVQLELEMSDIPSLAREGTPA